MKHILGNESFIKRILFEFPGRFLGVNYQYLEKVHSHGHCGWYI